MNRGMLLLASCLLVGVFGECAYGELRTWTDRAGRQIEAAFSRSDEKKVHLRYEGRIISIWLEQLSEADQRFVRDTRAAAKSTNTASTAAVAGESDVQAAQTSQTIPTLAQGSAPAKSANEANNLTSGWGNLIDPASFDQWTTVGAPDVFKLLPDGTVRGAGARAYLVSPKAYSDFELTGRMKVSGRGNGGVFFGVPGGMNLDSPRGYEVQLYVRKPGDNNGTGSIWQNGQLTDKTSGRFEVPERWYSFSIRRQGSSILIKIDDQTVFEKADAEYESGHIALQCYHAGGEVQYADMNIRDLAHGQATSATLAGSADKKPETTEVFAVFDIKLGMTDREVAAVLRRKGIRPADVGVVDDQTKGTKCIAVESRTPRSGPTGRQIFTDLAVEFAEDRPARPGTWVCIRIKYSKEFGDYGGVDLSPVWSKVRGDVIQRFGPPSKQSDNEILFGDENARYLKASAPYQIELEDKVLAKRLRNTYEQIKRDEQQRKAFAESEAVAEKLELNF